MGERRSLRLLEAPGVGVYDVRCSEPAGDPGPGEPTGVTQVVLPLEGVFAVHHGREAVTADPATAVVLRAGGEHRVGHPATDGDRSLVLVFPPEVVDEALGEDGLGGPVGPRAHLGARILVSALGRPGADELDAEETAHLLLGLVAEDLGTVRAHRPRGSHQRERVERVRELLAAAPERRWRLDELGRAVHASPFHLARQFRAAPAPRSDRPCSASGWRSRSSAWRRARTTCRRSRPTWGSRARATSARGSGRCSARRPARSATRSRPGGWPACARS